jgi:sulfur carrier protein ThiS
MKLKVRLYGTLPARFSDYIPEEGLVLTLPGNATVGMLLEKLGLDESGHLVTVVNGRVEKREHVLHEGVCVSIFQLVTGG